MMPYLRVMRVKPDMSVTTIAVGVDMVKVENGAGESQCERIGSGEGRRDRR